MRFEMKGQAQMSIPGHLFSNVSHHRTFPFIFPKSQLEKTLQHLSLTVFDVMCTNMSTKVRKVPQPSTKVQLSSATAENANT